MPEESGDGDNSAPSLTSSPSEEEDVSVIFFLGSSGPTGSATGEVPLTTGPSGSVAFSPGLAAPGSSGPTGSATGEVPLTTGPSGSVAFSPGLAAPGSSGPTG